MLKKEKFEMVFLVNVIGQHLSFLMNVLKTPFLQTFKDGKCCGKEQRKQQRDKLEKLKMSFLALLIYNSLKVGCLFKQ